MDTSNFDTLLQRSKKIRQRYHELEQEHHGSEWTVEEDALAFLTDAGLIGRHLMSQQGRWPKENTTTELQHKLAECIWWITILADRTNIDIQEAVEQFLTKTETAVGVK